MTDNNLQKKVAELEAQIRKLKKNNFGLVFEDKQEDVVEQSKIKVPVLKEVVKNRLCLDEAYPNNLMIEGDNYLALSVLNYTHKNKIDIIYIDPPYNTGARDWKYNNDYVDINDQWRHSKWLSFMNHRLWLARNLLSDNGVLICTIDHNELFALGLLMQKIFSDKEITCVTIVHNPSGIQGANFSHNNEYALFVHDKTKKVIANEQRSDENADIRPFINGAKGRGKNYLRESGYNCFYPILIESEKIIGFGDVCERDFHPKRSNVNRKDGIIEIYPVDKEGVERKWLFERDSVEEIVSELFVKKNKEGNYEIIRIKKSINYKTVWINPKFSAKKYGTELLQDILKTDFSFPKSLYAVEECIKAVVHNKDNALILDFFAGSGTTGHAVLEMNKIDGGNRKFILCTNNENNNGSGTGGIAETVCYPRIKAVINGYKNKKGEQVAGISSNLFYYKTDLVDIEQIHKVPDDAKIRITYEAGEMIAVREDTLNEVEKNNWWQIFEGKGKLTAIYFKENKEKLAELVTKLEKENLPTSLYIFSWGKNEYKGEYSTANIRVEDIPEPILEVYKELNRI